MKNHYNSIRFKEWLDKLQQESWQLELLISGFAIYGLFQAYDPLIIAHSSAQNQGDSLVEFALIITLTSCSILSFTLLLHVILRGLWIGALGLRYVSGDIDYKKLNYSPKFDTYLRKRIGSFDKYIARLENYCSILFAVSFLLIFYVLSFMLTIGAIVMIVFLIENDVSKAISAIGIISILFITFGMLLTLIDFLTQGYLKKKRWLSFIYFPFYWVFSFLTLSFLYRPLVYNFLDNKLGKRISYILIPLYIAITTIATFSYNRSNYLLDKASSSTYYSNKENYEEFLTKEGQFIANASIASKVIKTSYLKVFLEYNEKIENTIFDLNQGLKPEEDKRGLKSQFMAGVEAGVEAPKANKTNKKDSLLVEYFKTFKNIHTIKIDSTTYNDIDFTYTKNKHNQLGFETFLNIKNIEEGKHTLNISRLRKRNDSIETIEVATIPFWHYKD